MTHPAILVRNALYEAVADYLSVSRKPFPMPPYRVNTYTGGGIPVSSKHTSTLPSIDPESFMVQRVTDSADGILTVTVVAENANADLYFTMEYKINSTAIDLILHYADKLDAMESLAAASEPTTEATQETTK